MNDTQLFDLVVPFLPHKFHIVYNTVCKEWSRALKRNKYPPITHLDYLAENPALFEWAAGFLPIEDLLIRVDRPDILEKWLPERRSSQELTRKICLRAIEKGNEKVLEYLKSTDPPDVDTFGYATGWICLLPSPKPINSILWIYNNGCLKDTDLKFIGVYLFCWERHEYKRILAAGVPIGC